MLKLFNTLSRSVEEFKPLKPGKVGLYTCGPTVYDYPHIGNLRTFIFSDILYRTLKAQGYDVKFVQNITDIDDKIIKNAKLRNLSIEEFTKDYTQHFFADILKLNILPADVYPKATEHVGKMVKYIQKLLEKAFAYLEKDGSVYFDISKFPGYGKLSGLEKMELKSGTRILSDEYTKDDVQDFALWKSVGPKEFGYDSPWGKGRPGWHIECSVMSQEYLGETLDIHAGGIDLTFPHHENEIAQSEAYTGKEFARVFVHAEHLLVEDKKMSKSLGNFYTLRDIEAKGIEPLAFRYLVLTAHYRDKLNFTWESLTAAQKALDNLREVLRGLDMPGNEDRSALARFMEALDEDLNTSKAAAVMWAIVKSDLESSTKSATILKMDEVLGLGLEEFIGKKLEVPDKVQKLIQAREKAREEKDFKKSDELRKEIKKLGYDISDNSSGPQVKPAK